MRVIVFGDSIGQGMWDVHGGWVERLRTAYTAGFIAAKFQGEEVTFFNLSVSGDTSNEVLARFEPETKARIWRGQQPVIILAIGTNDTRLDGEIAFLERDRYADNIETILEKAKRLTDPAKILIAGLPAVEEAETSPVEWADVTYTNERIEQFEQTLSSVATAAGVRFVPLFNSFRQRMGRAEQLFSDGLHPNGDGHALIYDQVKPALDTIVRANA